MDRQHPNAELAALLDGELRDIGRVERLNRELASSEALRAEFEAQRTVKTLLGQLAAHEAPNYMATRILGEIALRRTLRRTYGRRIWAAAAAGFIVCLLAVGLVSQFYGPGRAPMLAQREHIPAPGLFTSTDNVYSAQDWSVDLPTGTDPQLRDFLEFASRQHAYRRMQHAAEVVTPDLPSAIQVVDEGVPTQ